MQRKRAIFSRFILATLLVLIAGCGGSGGEVALPEGQTPDREFTFESRMTGYVGKGGDIHGVKNPVLTARKGEVVRINIINAETMPHDIAMKAHNAKSKQILKTGEKASVTFVAEKDDIYYCTVPGHEQTGMSGEFKLVEEQIALAKP